MNLKFLRKREVKENPLKVRKPNVVQPCPVCFGTDIRLYQKENEQTFLCACWFCKTHCFAASDEKSAWEAWNERIFTHAQAEKWIAKNGSGRITYLNT